MKCGTEYNIRESLPKYMYNLPGDLLKETSSYTGLFLYKLRRGTDTGGGSQRCAAMLLLMSALHVYTGWQDMGADETSCHSPTLPFEERPWGEKVPQMGCEVYIHCPLLNRLRLMKCLMLRPYQPNPWWQFIPQLPKNTALWPSLARSGRQAQGGAQP